MKAATQRRSFHLLAWALKIIAALFFIRAGYSKLDGAERQIALFAMIGWGDWFRYLTGAIEIAAAALLLIPATGAFGALLLFGVSAGALLTLAMLELSVLPAVVTLVWTGGLLIMMRDGIVSVVGIWRSALPN